MDEHPFKSFIDLINFDRAIREAQEDLKRLDQDVADLKSQEQALTDKLDQSKQNVMNLRKQVDAQELEIKELDQQERDKKKTLEELASYKEYKPLQKEIDRLKQAQLEAEELLMGLWNKLEVGQKELAVQQQSYDTKVAELHAGIAEKEEKNASLQADVQQRNEQRPEKEKRVPEEWLEKYQHMRLRVDDPVVPVLSGGCSACFYAIPNQELLRLKRRALVQCKGCFRLLYMQEAMDEVSEVQATE